MYKVKQKYIGKRVSLNVKGFGLMIPLEAATPQHYLEMLYKVGHKAVMKEAEKKEVKAKDNDTK